MCPEGSDGCHPDVLEHGPCLQDIVFVMLDPLCCFCTFAPIRGSCSALLGNAKQVFDDLDRIFFQHFSGWREASGNLKFLVK